MKELASDSSFCQTLEQHVNMREEASKAKTWFQENYAKSPLRHIAYFSMEYGLSEALPIYSGGLGILAGDHLKAASDLQIPLTGIGLLYQEGYFRQAINHQGKQIEFYPANEPAQLPIAAIYDKNGNRVFIPIEFPGRTLWLRVWEVQVGSIRLYLLDSNHLYNSAVDRGITGELYGGGTEMRLQQEMILGIAGWRLLETLEIHPEVCHLNEGHAAFAILERARSFMKKHATTFQEALAKTKKGNRQNNPVFFPHQIRYRKKRR